MSHNLRSICALEIDDVDTTFFVLNVTGEESVNQPARYVVTAEPSARLDMFAFGEASISRPARLIWDPEGETPRIVHLVVDQVCSVHDGVRLELISRIGTLLDTRDHRIFLELDAIEITEELLTEHDFVLDVRCQRTLEKRAQCVQHFESDLGFVTRILAEEGIIWHEAKEERDTLVLTDSISGHDELAGGPMVVQVTGDLSDAAAGRSVHSVGVRHSVVTDKYVLRDYNFVQPAVDLTVEEKKGEGELERYEYRGNYSVGAAGKTLAGLWLEGCRAERRLLSASTVQLCLSPGQIVTLEGGSHESAEGKWLVIRLSTSADEQFATSGGFPNRTEFEAVPADAAYRVPRPEVPEQHGVQTMTVTGATGEEIETEEHGRIHAHFRWDRLRPFDDTASTWLRVTQPPNSGGFLLPRIQWETLMGFWTCADDPFVIGRLYNAEAPPPNGLPADKIVSAYGTLTTPGGGSANRFEFNDTAGNEAMNFNASYDYNERTENDKATSITVDETLTVGANQTTIIGQVHTCVVGTSQTYTVGANRKVSVDANKHIQATSETVLIGGARIFDIGGDQTTYTSLLTRVVGGAKAIAAIEHERMAATGGMVRTYGGSWTQRVALSVGVDVGGLCKTSIGGAKKVTSKDYAIKAGRLKEEYASRKEEGATISNNAKGAVKYDLKGNCSIKGSDVTFEATSKIEIDAGGVKITITDGKVVVKGTYKVSGGSADDGDQTYE